MKSAAPKPVANKQSLAVKESNSAVTNYKDAYGNEVSLSWFIINRFLAPSQDFTEEECWGLIGLCKARGLNPVAKDCYLQRYNSVPQVIVSRDYYQRRACQNKNFRGKQNGIAVMNLDGQYEEREGTILLPGETLLGGWCKVYMQNLEYPIKETVSFDEAKKTKQDGTLQATWKSMPATMVEKVAVVKALKAAMTEEFGGTYSSEELGFDESELESEVKPVDDASEPVQKEAQKEAPKEKLPKKAVDAEFVEVDNSTGEVVEEDDEKDFEDMQMDFFR